MKISCVINCDTRTQNDVAEHMFQGTVNTDYLIETPKNVRKFFFGFDIEVIMFVDQHLEIPEDRLIEVRELVDTLVIRKHTGGHSFNDKNYIDALSLCRNPIICHIDQDTALFTSGKEYVDELIGYLDRYRFVSYPSYWSPLPTIDESFGGKVWASTRFFLCKKEAIQIDVLRKCIEEPEWMYKKYGDSPRRLNWTEHFLTKVNDNSCYYPPFDINKGLIFCWNQYKSGTLAKLNNITYEEVKQYVVDCGGVHYPNDITCK